MENKLFSIIASIAAIVAATTCAPSVASPVNQDVLCVVEHADEDPAKRCRVGQKVAFYPTTFNTVHAATNVGWAAKYCDMTHSVVVQTGGVICIFHPYKRMDLPKKKK